jgi:uncharacterized membrane protein
MEIGKALMMAIFMAVISMPSAQAIVEYDVIVVRGDLPTDYTIASVYATTEKIPLVFVNPDGIQTQIRSELTGFREKGYQLLLIIGGESAISTSVEDELKGMGFIVNRLWDWDRYGTAARVAIELWGESHEVVITEGEDYSGFLLAQRIALGKGVPILFVKNSVITEQTRNAIRKIGAKSVTLISSERSTEEALKASGLTVEMVETATLKDSAGNPLELTDFYLVFSMGVIILLGAFILFRQSEKSNIVIMNEDEEKMIEILRIHGKTEQNKLAHLTGFSKPRISRMLRSLEDRGLIEREKLKKTFKIKLKTKIS